MAVPTTVSNLTEGGIPGIRHIPFGVHLCHFYSSRQDLVDILVPFLVFGVRNRERCIWITGPALPAADAHAELALHLKDCDRLCDTGRVQIVDCDAWFAGRPSADHAEPWICAEEGALAEGYAGVRIAGSLGRADNWATCMEREAAASAALAGRRIVALCGYDGTHCGWREIYDVIRSHHDTLHRSHGAWHVLEQPAGLCAAAAEVLRSMLGKRTARRRAPVG